MENLKIRVTNEQESKEAQELLFEMGFQWRGLKSPFDLFYPTSMDNYYIVLTKGSKEMQIAGAFRDGLRAWKEITLPELRAMVNPMKEYLNANFNYEFVLSNKKYDGFIEIPEGAIRARFYPNDPDALEFEGDFCQWWHDKDNEWINYENYSNTLKHSRVVWQREQDEPFLTPECTLNDQYAEIEEVRQIEIHGTVKSKPDFNFGAAQASGGVDATLAERQSTYGCFEDVAFVTENIMSILAKVRPDGLQDLPYAHRMALYMIASKMARIVNGDFNSIDGWHDIAGYATLIERLIGVDDV